MPDINVIELKPSELTIALEECWRSGVIPITLSEPGKGKSDIYFQTAARMKMRMVSERSSTMDQVDWRGIPSEDKKRNSTVWKAPDFLPRKDDPPTIVFVDEITQTPENCQAPLLQLFLDGKVGSVYEAPPGTLFGAAGNLTTDGSFSRKLGSALRNRMTFLYLKDDLDDWCRWAYGNDVPPSVIAFLRFRPELLNKFDKNATVSPTQRSWGKFIAGLVRSCKANGRIREALIQGTIGAGPAREYLAFEMIFNTLPSIDAIKMNPDTAQLPPANKPELAYAVANALSIHLTVGNIDRIVKYLKRLPEEYAIFAIKVALRRDPKLAHTPSYTKFAVEYAQALN